MLAVAASFFCPNSTETAVANGDTRTLILFHQNTKEEIVATFRQNGQYDQATLDKLNWFLRDWRRDEPTHMDPRLFDVVWEVYHAAGVVDQPIVVYSGYRSPETNAMLRRRSRQVAERSQHMLGKAMDSTMPGVSIEKLREIGMRMQRGGVGYYQSANFVHLDVGTVRSWPRMNYDQLARLFPDGKTVHIPSNGQPMARYEEARAEIEARGNGAYAPPSQSKSLFAWLFGSKDEEGDEEDVAPTSRRGRAPPVATAAAQPPAPRDVAAQAPEPQAEESQAQVASIDPRTAAGGATLDADAPTDARDGGTATPTFATTDPTAVAAIPMPPRRPLGLMNVADVPLPPARPVMSFIALQIPPPRLDDTPARPGRPDPIGKLIATTAVTARPAALPGVITQGTSDKRAAATTAVLTPGVLAYASDLPGATPLQAARPSPAVADGAADTALVPARLDRSNFRTLTGAASTAMTKTHAVLGPAVTGLRQAIHAVSDVFASKPSADYPSHFEARASMPDTTRFSGSAVQQLHTEAVLANSVPQRPAN